MGPPVSAPNTPRVYVTRPNFTSPCKDPRCAAAIKCHICETQSSNPGRKAPSQSYSRCAWLLLSSLYAGHYINPATLGLNVRIVQADYIEICIRFPHLVDHVLRWVGPGSTGLPDERALLQVITVAPKTKYSAKAPSSLAKNPAHH